MMSTAGLPVTRKKALSANTQTITMIVILVGIWLLFGLMTNFIYLSPRNLSNLFRQMTIIAFLTCGMVLVIVTGRIDLSVGSVTGFVSVIAARLQADVFPDLLPKLFPSLVNNAATAGLVSTILTIVISMAIGIAVGVYQGALIAYLEVPAFIVTLGGMLVFRGGVIWVTRGESIMPITASLTAIGQGYLSDFVGLIIAAIAAAIIFLIVFTNRAKQKQYGLQPAPFWRDMMTAGLGTAGVFIFIIIMNFYRGLQAPVLLLVVTVVVMSYVTTSTRFGRYSYAIGGNVEATRLSGINIKKNVFLIFVLMGFLCAVSGIVLTGYLASGSIGAGQDYELKAIAACILGGTSPLGGSGTIVGAMVGSLIMQSLDNGISVMNLPVYLTKVVPGLVLVLATYLDVATRKRRGAL
jgi:D-xylose transport system permease protein